MAFSEESWWKSVELRQKAVATHPQRPNIPLFPPAGSAIQTPVWDYFPPTWQCPHDVQRVGNFGDGGKWMCGMTVYESYPAPKGWKTHRPPKIPTGGSDGIVVYSFGVRDDSTYEAELLKRLPAARIWGYDFSVDTWGPQIAPENRNRTFFHKVGLGDTDMPTNDPPFYTLQTLMWQNNHTYIDILKIDVEAAEFKALDAFMDHVAAHWDGEEEPVLPIGQVMIELHIGYMAPEMTFAKFEEWWEKLETMGMRPTWMELNLLTVTLAPGRMDPLCTEYVWVNVRDRQNKLWKDQK